MSATWILGIETSTPAGGIALAGTGGELIAQRWSVARNGFSRRLMPMIDAALMDLAIDKTNLAAIAVTRGPGSFTGVRVGLVTAKTLAYALGAPLYLYSTLESIAMRCPLQEGVLCAALDARRNEIYSGIYRKTAGGAPMNLEQLREPMVEPCGALLDAIESGKFDRVWFTGDAAMGRRDEISARLGKRAHFIGPPWNLPAADIVAIRAARDLAEGRPSDDPFAATPIYLRPSDAERQLARRGG